MPHSILHLVGTAQPEGTGIARSVGALASGLDPEKYSVQVWFLGEDGPLAAELRASGVQVRVIDWWRGARDPAGMCRFWSALRGEQFAIIHQHFGGRSVRWIARRAMQTSIIVHLRGRVCEARGPALVRPQLWGADAVIAVSEAVAKSAVGVRPQVVYTGVPFLNGDRRGLITPGTLKERIIGTACRLVPIKGLCYLVRAFATLHAEMPNLRLEIAGAGPMRGEIEDEVQSLGLAGAVTFLGWQTDLTPVLAAWDVFVLPSLDEGFPTAALGAMAAGLPVVASGVGGVPELVEDGRTGWLVPPGDSAALADRLRAVLLDPEQRRAMGAAGRARVKKNFSVDRMVAAVSKIYDEVLASRRPR